MKRSAVFIKIQKKSLKALINESYLGIVLIGLVSLTIGIINVLIEHSKGQITPLPIIMFIIPALYFFILSYQTKNLKHASEYYFIAAMIYIFICFIEFYLGYELDDFMRVYFSEDGDNHPMGYILQIVPLIYKAFKVGLAIIMFRIWYLLMKYQKLNLS